MTTFSLLTFSPTGNAAYLAGQLAERLAPADVTLLPLEFTRKNKLEPADHLVLLYPIHAFNVPRNVKQYIQDLPGGLYKHVSLIAVGSGDTWMNAAVNLELRRNLGRKGYPILVDTILAMPVTIMVSLPHNTARKLIDASVQELDAISAALKAGEASRRSVPARARLVNILGKVENLGARMFGLELHASDDCISCGTCWNNCPSKNITRSENGKPSFGLNCLMCMRCIYNCPQMAISPRFSKFVPIKGGYSLADYVDVD